MSDLLNSASLVMIPSGYKEDTVYSVVPSDGSGDMAFTRASNGTRVNSAGLVEVCPWNMLTYSEDLSDAIWTKEPGNSITTNSTTAPNGTTTADTISATASNELNTYQFANTDAGVFTYSVYIKKNATNLISTYIYQSSVGFKARGEINFDNGTFTTSLGTGAIESVGNGWYKVFLTATLLTAQHSFGFYTDSVTGTRSVYAWGAQANIGSTAKSYFPTTDRLNVPRLTYQNGGGGCPSLLLEKQSTNILTYSEQFDNAVWAIAGGITITANATTSPDGTQNADLLSHGSFSTYLYQNLGTLSGTITTSIFVKKGSQSSIAFGFVAGGFTGGMSVKFNLDTQTFSTPTNYANFTSISATYQSLGNGWYRLNLTGTTATSDTYYYVLGSLLDSFAVNAYLYGGQVEASSYPTSYIPTTSSSATRVADACSKTGISSLFGTNQGTFFIDFVYYGSEQFSYIFDVTDSANSNRFLMYDSTGAGLYALYDSGYSQITTYQFTKGQRYKIAVKYNSSGTIWYVNGVLSGTGTVSFAHQMSQLYLGIRYSITDNTGMTVNESIVFPTALSGTDLIALTTI